MDRLDAISLFTKIVETGSLSEAARQTGRSPASDDLGDSFMFV